MRLRTCARGKRAGAPQSLSRSGGVAYKGSRAALTIIALCQGLVQLFILTMRPEPQESLCLVRQRALFNVSIRRLEASRTGSPRLAGIKIDIRRPGFQNGDVPFSRAAGSPAGTSYGAGTTAR